MSWRLGNGKLRKDQTDHYGRVKNGGGGGITIDDFGDSDTIGFEKGEDDKVYANLVAELVTKIGNSLQTPLTTPLGLELVGIDTNKEQARINIGNGLDVASDDNLIVGGVTPLTINGTFPTELSKLKFVICSKAQYDSLTTKDTNTLYIING